MKLLPYSVDKFGLYVGVSCMFNSFLLVDAMQQAPPPVSPERGGCVSVFPECMEQVLKAFCEQSRGLYI